MSWFLVTSAGVVLLNRGEQAESAQAGEYRFLSGGRVLRVDRLQLLQQGYYRCNASALAAAPHGHFDLKLAGTHSTSIVLVQYTWKVVIEHKGCIASGVLRARTCRGPGRDAMEAWRYNELLAERDSAQSFTQSSSFTVPYVNARRP